MHFALKRLAMFLVRFLLLECCLFVLLLLLFTPSRPDFLCCVAYSITVFVFFADKHQQLGFVSELRVTVSPE